MHKARPADQDGQMLVSVIVLLTLMFFVGSAMALAVSSSLHTIAQTNNTDSAAYAAESAVAQGFARTATPVALAPTVASETSAVPLAPPVGCNNGITSGGGGGGNGANGNRRNGGNGGNNSNGGSISAAFVALAASGATTWSYAYEVVADDGVERDLVGRSFVGTDNQGPDLLSATSYETITIPYIPVTSIAGAKSLSFEVYRTAGPSSLGCIGVFAQQAGGTLITDSGPVSPAPPMCTKAGVPLFSKVNGYGPGAGSLSLLTASTCRVPIADPSSTEPTPLHMWSEPGQTTTGACTKQSITPAFSPGEKTPATVWGSIGWHSTSSAAPAKLDVSTSSCSPSSACTVRDASPGVLYYWCDLAADSPAVDTIYIRNTGGSASVTAFVVRAATSGTDCVSTTIGAAGLTVDESAQEMPGCAWTSATQNMWNRVLP